MSRKNNNPLITVIVVILLFASATISYKAGMYLTYEYTYKEMVEQTIKALVNEESLK